MKKKKYASWKWIIIWLIVFAPVGLYSLFKKFGDRAALMSTKPGKLRLLGILLIIVGVIGLSTNPPGYYLVINLLWVVAGIILLVKVSKAQKDSVKFRRYIDIVVNNGERSLDNIAAVIGLPYETVSKDLQDMINLEFFRNTYIDPNGRQIVLPQAVQYAPYPEQRTCSHCGGSVAADAKFCPSCGKDTAVSAPASGSAQTVIRCPSCGANNVVATGRVTECEYCGSPLTA
jgi:hypothetical protein